MDLTGRRFGKWRVLARATDLRRATMYQCRCTCGTERAVRAAHLTSGAATSCGCDLPALQETIAARKAANRAYAEQRRKKTMTENGQ